MAAADNPRKSRKHKLSFLAEPRADSQDVTQSDCTSSAKAGQSWEESDEVSSFFCNRLSALSIPSRHECAGRDEQQPRKKLKRRKNRKAKRSRVKSSVQISESSDVTPTSPASCSNLKMNMSDETVAEAMSTGANSSDSSVSLGYITDLGGTDADDELSCWEGVGTCRFYSSDDETDITLTDQVHEKRRCAGAPLTGMRLHFKEPTGPPLKTVNRREKLKTRHRPAARDRHQGGSSTSSPSMTIDCSRKFMVSYVEGGPSTAMQTGD